MLEHNALGIVQECRDLSVSTRYMENQVAIVLIQPQSVGLPMQICFVYGFKKWGKRFV